MNCSECQKQLLHTTCSPHVLSLEFSCIELVYETCCVQNLFLTFRTIFVHNMFSPCSAKRRASDKDLTVLTFFEEKNRPQCRAVPHMARQCTALQCQCIHEESSRSLRSNQSNVDYRGGSVTDAFINVPSSSAQGYLVIKWYSLQIDMKNDISFKSGAHVQVSSDLLRYIRILLL